MAGLCPNTDSGEVMKGSIGTSTYLVYTEDYKKKYKAHKTRFCIKCKGWIVKEQWFNYSKSGKTKHHYKKDCKKV